MKNKAFLSKLLIDPFFRNAVVILIPFYVISTVFPLISAGPRISAASLGIHVKISASSLISAVHLNAGLTRIVTIFY